MKLVTSKIQLHRNNQLEVFIKKQIKKQSYANFWSFENFKKKGCVYVFLGGGGRSTLYPGSQ